ncbi:cytochrome P450 84A1-like [Pyrus ussuriensis x Pyrus communis]|uniref:Cytochrome P450 84A1-like n=1 Tax=Pyrus ussuriensis x Pyrus communis TaxID=2448454 RepID=A0A5N5FJB5_9ROSA|nr:cytochrome P450 84A1-like [Pyrus ussuriensis x Pyrus communis]
MELLRQALQSLQSSPMLLILLLLLVISLIFLFNSRRKLPYPPGPKGWPIIGNMLMTDQLNHRGLAHLAKQYGGLLHLQMGAIHIIAVSTPDTAREILQVQDSSFANRPANVALSYLTYDRADMAFANYGPFWRRMRKICVINLFSRKRAESWASVREEVNEMVQTVAGKTGSPVNIGQLVFALTRNITYRAAFGSRSHEGQGEFVKILQEFSKLFGAFNMQDFLPWLGWVHAQGFQDRMARARKSLDVFIDKIIDDHMAKRKANMENKDDSEAADTDMVDELIAYFSDDAGKEGDDPNSGFKLTRDNIKALIMDVMFGGTETVASVIEWTMAELMKSPEDLKRVQQELTDVVGLNRRLQETDLENLTYLKCAVKESLRLHPPIPLLLHETVEDTSVAGYSFPAGSRVWINAWAIARDPTAWDEPETFKPSRFLDDVSPDFKGSNFEFIPFGSGRRSCPGMALGLYGLEMAVAHLLHCFAWELPGGMKPSELDMNDVFGLTAPKAVQLVAVPTYRLNCPL